MFCQEGSGACQHPNYQSHKPIFISVEIFTILELSSEKCSIVCVKNKSVTYRFDCTYKPIFSNFQKET